jgi:hypothetical protein
LPRYLIVRRFDVSENEMPEVGRRSRRTIEESYPEITWEHSHVVIDGAGTVLTYCIYDAPDEPMLRAHAADLGSHTIEAVHEIAGDITPADFPG